MAFLEQTKTLYGRPSTSIDFFVISTDPTNQQDVLEMLEKFLKGDFFCKSLLSTCPDRSVISLARSPPSSLLFLAIQTAGGEPVPV